MDFVRILKSLEELSYEIMVMLLFFPRTLWLTLRYPQRMMDYADTELGDVQSEQYDDTLSPPLFLLICLGIGWVVGTRTHPDVAAIPAFLRSPENLVAFRLLLFSLFPLVMAAHLLGRLRIPVSRKALRAPFFAQCFAMAPVAMLVSLALALPAAWPVHGVTAALLLVGAAIAWFLRQQAHWFRAKLGCGTAAGWGHALLASAGALALFFLSIAAVVLLAPDRP